VRQNSQPQCNSGYNGDLYDDNLVTVISRVRLQAAHTVRSYGSFLNQEATPSNYRNYCQSSLDGMLVNRRVTLRIVRLTLVQFTFVHLGMRSCI